MDKMMKKNNPLFVQRSMPWPDMNMFLYGEKGSGKKIYAKILHQQSSTMYGKPFIHRIIDSDPVRAKRDIFGCLIDGQFHPGFIDEAKHGTLYLHDIANLSDETLRELINSINKKSYIPIDSKESKINETRIFLSTDMISLDTGKLSLDRNIFNTPVHLCPMRLHHPDSIEQLLIATKN